MLSIIRKNYHMIRVGIFNRKWRKKNKHNLTEVITLFPINCVSVGNATYGSLFVRTYGNPNEKLIIGSYCSIADGVHFLLGGEHSLETITSYPVHYKLHGSENTICKGKIIIKDDVWIGHGALILSGVTIGQGAVIAAGAVVSKDVPPYAIVAGNPARIIRYRFPKEIIEKLNRVDYSKVDDKMLMTHERDFYLKVESLNQLDWLPQK